MPASDRSLRQTLDARSLDLCKRMGREQSPKEMARSMGITERHVRRLITQLSAATGVSPLRLAMLGLRLNESERKAPQLDTTAQSAPAA